MQIRDGNALSLGPTRTYTAYSYVTSKSTMAIQNLRVFVFLLTIQLTAATIIPTAFSQPNTIERDVCIIGGGSSGTYAAVRLLQNEKSVAIIEKQNGIYSSAISAFRTMRVLKILTPNRQVWFHLCRDFTESIRNVCLVLIQLISPALIISPTMKSSSPRSLLPSQG